MSYLIVYIVKSQTFFRRVEMISSAKSLLLILFSILFLLDGNAQTISRKYEQVPMSQVLADINSASTDYDLFFLYDELEMFPVTCQIKRAPFIEAIRKIIGFYPVKMTISDHRIFLECTQKKNAVVRGRVISQSSAPIPYASVTLSYPHSGEKLNTGICNESGDFSVPCDSMSIFVKISCVGYKSFTGVFDTGDIGVVRLQPITYHLHPIEVSQQRRKGKTGLSKTYHRHAEKIRKEVWNTQDTCFGVMKVPDSLLIYPEIVIAQSQDYSYKRKFLFRPWHLLTLRMSNPLGAYRTTSISIDRRRVLINDEQMAEKYTLLDYPRDIIISNNPDKDVVMGVRVIKPDGSFYEVETDRYTQPIEYNEPSRPDHITVEGLEKGDIIDYFVWTQAKTYSVNPEPALITIGGNCPQLYSKVSVNIDKNLNVQYRLVNDADTLQMKSEADGNIILLAHYNNLEPMGKEKKYAVYVRDDDLKVNAPLNAKGHEAVVNPDIHDVLTTRMGIYENMKMMSESKKWKVRSWNETDTTVVSAIVSNLSHKTNSKELLTEALYYQALRFPSYLVEKYHSTDGCENDIFLNREYTIMFAHMLLHAGIPFQIAMTTKKNREDVDQLMDENNIVWMIRTDNGHCFIPRFDGIITSDENHVHVDGMAQQLVGQKAQLLNGYHSFVITDKYD